MRRILVQMFAAGMSLLAVATAFAAPGVPNDNRPNTLVLHDVGDVFTDVLPCADASYELTVTYRTGVIHTAAGDDSSGEEGGTFIENATFVAVAVDDPSLPSFEGSFQAHGRVTIDEAGPTAVILTQTIRGMGSDGSTINFHETTNALFSDEGDMVSGFDKAFCSNADNE